MSGVRWFALTGGPGAGKTTKAAEFARRGYAVAGESGRAVVQDRPESATALRTPAQQALFAAMMWERDVATMAWAATFEAPVIFDRTAVGSLDVAGDEVLARQVRLTGPVALLPVWPAS